MARKVYGLGETILDIIFKNNQVQDAKPGGSAFNTLVSLGRLRQEAYLISEFGTDSSGALIESFMKENGVRADYVNRFEGDYKTPISIANIQENGDAEYSFYKDYPSQRLSNIQPDFQEDDILIFGSYYALNPALRAQVESLVKQAKQAGALIVYDPNFRKTHNKDRESLRQYIEWNMQMADIVRASDEDLHNIFQLTSIEQQMKQLKTLCNNCIITANQAGIHMSSEQHTLFVESDKIQPISTIGAGDTFNAGIIFSLLKDGITIGKLSQTNVQTWENTLNRAKTFATNCCLSMDNYIELG